MQVSKISSNNYTQNRYQANNMAFGAARDSQFYTELSKNMAYALRHHPTECGLHMNKEGFVLLDELLAYFGRAKKELAISKQDIVEAIDNSTKKRFEIKDEFIRAFYGHSCSQQVVKQLGEPPKTLYHGTSPDVAEIILKEGLKKQSRQFAHLSTDIRTAVSVGARRGEKPVVLKIDTQKAQENGINFYIGNDNVWLSEFVPPEYISLLTPKKG